MRTNKWDRRGDSGLEGKKERAKVRRVIIKSRKSKNTANLESSIRGYVIGAIWEMP